MATLKLGNPLDESTDVGPLSSLAALEALEDQVERTVEMGARLLLGGKRLNRAGYYYPPTVLTEIPHDSPAYREELFGPVASLFRVGGIEEAVALANDSRFGLGASCWTDNQREREYFVREIESGLAFINGMVASDPRLPFGGVKQSGYGRELSVHGIREFVNTKTVSIYEIAAHRSETE
jgi:succinate-semialdehyde dehydrogenase/glutarate-semialdehyde dehydrogenase